MKEDQNPSQSLKAILGIRGLIIDGTLRPGERVSELFVADRLGVSRTPVRAALLQLKEEGLLEALPSGGFAVTAFGETDMFDAIAIRGTLEGMAARFAVERGIAPRLLAQMRRCVSQLDDVVDRLDSKFDVPEYLRLNDRFHELLAEAAQSAMLQRALARAHTLPFAAPHTFADAAHSDLPHMRTQFVVAQDQHRSILEAIQNREGARAEALAIEHARSTWKYLRAVLDAADATSGGGKSLRLVHAARAL